MVNEVKNEGDLMFNTGSVGSMHNLFQTLINDNKIGVRKLSQRKCFTLFTLQTYLFTKLSPFSIFVSLSLLFYFTATLAIKFSNNLAQSVDCNSHLSFAI